MKEKLKQTWERFAYLLDAVAVGIMDGIYDFFRDKD